jgi:glycosyltransferase involved in cell wall biosynthesis
LQPVEVVLVQDGPVGLDIATVISKFEHRNNFSLIKLPINKGLANALNVGLQYIRTTFVVRADADDYNLVNRFEKQIIALSNGYDLVGGFIREVDRSGNAIAIRSVPTSQDDIKRFITKRNPFNHMTVAYRRSTVVNLGGYPDIFLKEDYALWASMVSRGVKMTNLDEILVHATAGVDMYKRRGGIKYERSEIDLQKLLIKMELQTILGGIFIGLSRSLVFLMPAFLRGFVYERFLRESF